MAYTTDDGETTETEVEDENSCPGKITTLERLIRTHPIWFLPSIKERDGVEQLLKGKERGVSAEILIELFSNFK